MQRPSHGQLLQHPARLRRGWIIYQMPDGMAFAQMENPDFAEPPRTGKGPPAQVVTTIQNSGDVRQGLPIVGADEWAARAVYAVQETAHG